MPKRYFPVFGRLARPLAVVMLAVAPLAAAAQTPAQPPAPRPDSSARRIEPVVVTGTRAPTAVGGAATVVVTLDSLRTAPAPSLEAVLRETPFVLVRQNSRGEAELSIRGSDSRQAAVLVDGLPLTLGWDHRTDPSIVPLTGARRVHVMRGIPSLLLGPNVLGGVVEVDVAGGPATTGGSGTGDERLGVAIDQYGAHVVTAAAGSGTTVGRVVLSARGGGAHRRRAGVAFPGSGRDSLAVDDFALRANTDLRQTDGFLALRAERRGGAWLSATAAAYGAARGVAPELHLKEPRLWRYPDVSRALGIVSAGSGLRRTPFGYGRIDVATGANDGHVAIESFATPRYDSVVGRELGDERTYVTRVGATHSLLTGGELRLGLTSADVHHDETVDAAPRARYRQLLTSVGMEAEVPVWLARVAAGMVRDHASTPETGGRAAQPALGRWGWRAGLTVPLRADALRLHGAVSRRSRFPALRELYSGSLARFQPNPDLRPETLTALELGGTLAQQRTSGARTTVQAVGFAHRLEDAVVRITLPDRRFRRINRDALHSTGAELVGEWASGGVGSRRVTIAGDLLAQRVRVRDPLVQTDTGTARFAEHQPQLRASATVGVPLPFRVRGEAGMRHVGRQYCQHPDLGRQVALGAFTTTDAALTHDRRVSRRGLLRHLRTMLALDNAADVTGWDQCGMPQPGRTLRVSVELRS